MLASRKFSSAALHLLSLSLALVTRAQTYSATYLPSNAPDTTEEGQSGTNKCGTDSNQTSNCQNAYSTSVLCRQAILN